MAVTLSKTSGHHRHSPRGIIGAVQGQGDENAGREESRSDCGLMEVKSQPSSGKTGAWRAYSRLTDVELPRLFKKCWIPDWSSASLKKELLRSFDQFRLLYSKVLRILLSLCHQHLLKLFPCSSTPSKIFSVVSSLSWSQISHFDRTHPRPKKSKWSTHNLLQSWSAPCPHLRPKSHTNYKTLRIDEIAASRRQQTPPTPANPPTKEETAASQW